MASSKWFDLRNEGAMIERFKSQTSGVYLKLTVKNAGDFTTRAEQIVSAGWEAAPDEENAFINSSRLVAMSEIKKALTAFFDMDDIKIGDVSQLPGNIYTGSFERGQPADAEMITPNLLGMTEDKQAEILQRVIAAASLAGIGSNIARPFKGEVLRSWDRAFERYGPDASGLIMAAVTEHTRGNLDALQSIEEALLSSDAQNADEVLKHLSSEIADMAKMCIQRINDHPLCVTDENGKEGNRTKLQHWSALSNESPFDRLPVTFLDAHLVEPRKIGERNPDQILGISVRYEASLPTELKWQSARRIERALSTVKDYFGAPSGFVLGYMKTSFMVSKNSLSEAKNGNFRSRVATDYALGQIHYSPYSASALIHEIGHAMDYGFMPKDSDNKYKQVLDETGVMQDVLAQIKRAEAAGIRFPERYRDYLLAPAEIFARTFERVMVAHCHKHGDYELAAIGGALRDREDFSSHDPELLSLFAGAIKDWNNEFARQRQYEQEQHQRNDIGSGSPTIASL